MYVVTIVTVTVTVITMIISILTKDCFLLVDSLAYAVPLSALLFVCIYLRSLQYSNFFYLIFGISVQFTYFVNLNNNSYNIIFY